MTTVGRAALLIVDIQNDFCAGGTLAVAGADRVIAALNQVIPHAVANDLTIYATRDWHPAVTSHFLPYGGMWPVHCVRGTHGARFHPDLHLPPTAIIVNKGEHPDSPGYSAFEGHTADGGQLLLTDLRQRGIGHVYIGGLTTDYCVRQSALDGLAAGLQVTVFERGIAGVDVHPGDSARAMIEICQKGVLLNRSGNLDEPDRGDAPSTSRT